jgi:hypothetical protein
MRTLALIAALGVLLIAALAAAAYLWSSLAEVEIGFHGVLALVLGVLLSLVLGGGLMALVFYSSRHGHDEVAGETPDAPRARQPGDRPDDGPSGA